MLILGDPRQVDVSCTNWQRAKFFNVDFGGARIDRDGFGDGRACRPSYINVAAPRPLDISAMCNLVAVTGKDGVANWWVQVVARDEVWGKIEEWVRGEYCIEFFEVHGS